MNRKLKAALTAAAIAVGWLVFVYLVGVFVTFDWNWSLASEGSRVVMLFLGGVPAGMFAGFAYSDLS